MCWLVHAKFLKGNKEEGEMEEGKNEGEKLFFFFTLILKGRCNANAPFACKLPCTIWEIPVEDPSLFMSLLTLSASPSSVHFSPNSDWVS